MWHIPPWLVRPVYIRLPSASLHPHTSHTKGYHVRSLICIWNAPSYASSVLSAIWPSPRGFKHHAVLIESVLVWNTHTHTLAITHTGDFVANGGRVRDGCQAQCDGQSSITACHRCLFFPRLPASLICFCLEQCFLWKMGSRHMTGGGCCSQLLINSTPGQNNCHRCWPEWSHRLLKRHFANE